MMILKIERRSLYSLYKETANVPATPKKKKKQNAKTIILFANQRAFRLEHERPY